MLNSAGAICVNVGLILGKYNMAKHFTLRITENTFAYERNPESIAREAALDGIYVIRTNLASSAMDAGQAVRTYKSLANVEKISKTPKSRDLGIRPIRHSTEDRTRTHVFLCMLTAHLTWHLRTALAPLTYSDEDQPIPQDSVTNVERSAAAQRNAGPAPGNPPIRAGPTASTTCSPIWPREPGTR